MVMATARRPMPQHLSPRLGGPQEIAARVCLRRYAAGPVLRSHLIGDDRIVSGFTRDAKYYGDRLVYEALYSKWDRYHSHCGCGQDWVSVHAEPAGFEVVRRGSGFVALIGAGLTDDVDEEALTTNALWEAVTGLPGRQDWFETVRVFPRAAESREPAVRKPSTPRKGAPKSKAAPALTAAQSSYLRKLATQVSRLSFDDALTMAAEGSGVPARAPGETTVQLIDRLPKAVATRLISTLVVLRGDPDRFNNTPGTER